MKEAFIKKRFHPGGLDIIIKSEKILDEYAADGYTLTLRQLFYQLVTTNAIKNDQAEYKRLSQIISDARLCGLIDWKHLEDRVRNIREIAHWEKPKDILKSAAESFKIDKWNNQKYYPEVWVEKDAIAMIVERACAPWEVPFFACRGYVSQSEMYYASKRIMYKAQGKIPIIYHIGDHDPSGIDMTRDMKDRLEMFMGEKIIFKRLALNMDQIKKLQIPPNPAKMKDSRYLDYKKKFGNNSWELDALKPKFILELIQGEIKKILDKSKWEAKLKAEKKLVGKIKTAAKKFDKKKKKPKKAKKKAAE